MLIEDPDSLLYGPYVRLPGLITDIMSQTASATIPACSPHAYSTQEIVKRAGPTKGVVIPLNCRTLDPGRLFVQVPGMIGASQEAGDSRILYRAL